MDEGVVKRAKRYAAGHRTSVSRLIEDYLKVLGEPPRGETVPPVVARLRGILKGAKLDREDYYRYLERKYR